MNPTDPRAFPSPGGGFGSGIAATASSPAFGSDSPSHAAKHSLDGKVETAPESKRPRVETSKPSPAPHESGAEVDHKARSSQESGNEGRESPNGTG